MFLDDKTPDEVLPTTEVGRDEIFLAFALIECGRALDSLDRVEQLASTRQFDERRQVETREWISVFDAIRMALHFTGSVSRVFFPIYRGGKFKAASEIAKARAKRLLELTEIPNGHLISKRALRDDVEHMDERLDAWIGGSRRPFGAIEMIIHDDYRRITRNSIERSCPFLYYEETGEISVFGNRISIDDWRQSLQEVRDQISLGYETLLREARLDGRNHLT